MKESLLRKQVEDGSLVLGIELGSTRIKALLINENYEPVLQSSYEWKSRLEEGIWTYDEEEIWKGIRSCYSQLVNEILVHTKLTLKKLKAIGFSGMMHGYMPLDEKGKVLVPFRTWQNTITKEESEYLTKLFSFHIPQRWTIAHLLHAIMKKEEHIREIDYLTTLSGYIHWKLTGRKVVGIGEASGIFPIDEKTKNYKTFLIERFHSISEVNNSNINISDILPEVLVAGEVGGFLTKEGAALLDESGNLESGIVLCPPEGDSSTGMVATNSIEAGTGNISAGTSIFGTVVLEKPLSKVYSSVDMLNDPEGKPVAMIHCNNGTADLKNWVELFREFAQGIGSSLKEEEAYNYLFNKALEGEEDAGGLVTCNYLSGEHITGIEVGRPLFLRGPDSQMNLGNFMRSHIYAVFTTLRQGFDVLFKEKVQIKELYGHGGFFKTKGIAQSFLASALKTPIAVAELAGEGGAWGIAILAAYMTEKENFQNMNEFLKEKIFLLEKKKKIYPDSKTEQGFNRYMDNFSKVLEVEMKASQVY